MSQRVSWPHQGRRLYMAGVALLVVGITGEAFPIIGVYYPASPVLLQVAGPAIAAAGWALAARHDQALCRACVKAFPAAPGKVVERRRLALYLLHLFWQHPGRTTFVGLVAAPGAAAVVMLAAVGASPPLLTLAYVYTVCPLAVGLTWAYATHRQVAPWCPYCHPDEGTDA